MRILWADDQTETASTFAGLLQFGSHAVVFARDAQEALQCVRGGVYDVILADLRMPPGDWGGLWLLEQLKSIRGVPPVIVVSGEGAQQETIQALRLGAVDYITKDKLQEELVRRIELLESTIHTQRSVSALLNNGENQNVEFKSTLRFNLRAQKFDTAIELATLKTIAAFLNSSGGTLLIGAADSGEVLGIENDQFPNADKFQLHFWNLVREKIGAEVSNLLTTGITTHSNKELFRVDCKPSERPIFVKWKATNEPAHQDLFFVRAGPQTEQLGTRQALSYIESHFHRFSQG